MTVHEKNILRIFLTFSKSGYLDWRLNTSFISLIPKINGPSNVKDFRSIALLSGLYKLLAKVLANRLKPVLSQVVSDFQGLAMEGRHIQDLSLMANEMLDSWYLKLTSIRLLIV